MLNCGPEEQSSKRIQIDLSQRGWSWIYLILATAFIVGLCNFLLSFDGGSDPLTTFYWFFGLLSMAIMTVGGQDWVARSFRLVLNPQTLTLTRDWQDYKVILWESVASMTCVVENATPLFLRLKDADGKTLLLLPLVLMKSPAAKELISLIAVRMPPDTSIKMRTTNLLTRLANLFAAAFTGLVVYWVFPGHWTSDPNDNFLVVSILLTMSFMIPTLWFLTRGLLGIGMAKRGARAAEEYRNALQPYLLWWLAGVPVPGARSFQYPTETARGMVKRSAFQVTLLYTFLGLCILAVFSLVFLSSAATLKVKFVLSGILMAALWWPSKLLVQSQRETKSLHSQLIDEVVLDETSISVWHDGAFQNAKIWGDAMNTEAYGPRRMISLSLEGKRLDFDSTAMQVLEKS